MSASLTPAEFRVATGEHGEGIKAGLILRARPTASAATYLRRNAVSDLQTDAISVARVVNESFRKTIRSWMQTIMKQPKKGEVQV